jgi:pimeloyl-ACP methyl ester carboxylesterase
MLGPLLARLRAGRLPPDEMWPAHDPRVGSRFVTLGSGACVRVAEAGDAGAPPVLLLPGWGVCAYTWRGNLLPIADAGFRAIAADLRGHGRSDKPVDPGSYTLAAMTAHALEIMDALGLRRAALVGQSMGGRIALEVALAHADRVSALGLVSAVGIGEVTPARIGQRFSGRAFAPLLPLVVRRSTVWLAMRETYGHLGRVTRRDVDEYWAQTQFPEFARATQLLLGEFDWTPLPPERLRALRVPVLLVRGSIDRLVRVHPPPSPLLDPVAAPKRFYLIEGGGHAVNEEAPERVNTVLIEHLCEHAR